MCAHRDRIVTTHLYVEPDAPESAVRMPHCKLERQTLSDKELEIKDVRRL